jgi:biotin operon repressor
LAQNRINKVVKTLVNLGIQIERLEQKGYRAEQNSERAIDAIPLCSGTKENDHNCS